MKDLQKLIFFKKIICFLYFPVYTGLMKTKAFIVFIFMFPFFSNADLANWEKYQSCLAKLVPPKVKDLESCKESEEYCNKIFFRVLFSTIHFCKDAHFKEKSANWCRAEEDVD